jgi:hypothetical protein
VEGLFTSFDSNGDGSIDESEPHRPGPTQTRCQTQPACASHEFTVAGHAASMAPPSAGATSVCHCNGRYIRAVNRQSPALSRGEGLPC